MKKIKLIFSCALLIAIAVNCSTPDGIDTDVSSLSTASSSNNSNIFDISTNNSGLVKITPIGDGVSNFSVSYGHGNSAPVSVAPGASTSHVYPEGSYTVTIVSYDVAGHATTVTYPLNVVYTAPTNVNTVRNFAGTVLTLTATATNANGFTVNWGDGSLTQSMTGSLGGTFTVPDHNYAPGVYTLTVNALSGGAANTTVTYPITVYAPYSLPITYENPIQNYGIGGTFGGVDVAVVANPSPGGINTSANVWRFTKNAGAASWAGTWTPLAAPNGVPIDFNNGNKFKVMVYATQVGELLHFQLEQPSVGIGNQAIDVPITVANQWQELTFDFSTLGIPAGTTFKQLVFQYNLAGAGTGEVIYIDNITQTN